jgi:Fe2+ or Zn2+ uptake regulation protein
MDDGVKLQLTQDVEKQSGYTISRRQFYFFGLCTKCSTMH